MSADAYSVILFHTSNHAFRAEKVLKERGLSCKLVPVPRHLSSECGVCLRVEHAQLDLVTPVLLAAQVEIASTHDA